ncbi:hypothetical protein BDW72DRAFT_29547 [Aspergillus terricola var. indicus]
MFHISFMALFSCSPAPGHLAQDKHARLRIGYIKRKPPRNTCSRLVSMRPSSKLLPRSGTGTVHLRCNGNKSFS